MKGCALDDVDAWRKANPAMGRRITVEHIASERRTLEPAEFARERLGWWDEPEGAASGIAADLWESALTKAQPSSAVAYAVDVTPEFTYSSVARCSKTADGLLVEVIDHRRGTDWCGKRVAELVGDTGVPVVVDKGGPSVVVIGDLEAQGIDPKSPTTGEVAQACAGFVDGMQRGALFHRGQPELDAAAKGAVRAPLGDAWKWSRKSSTIDISPLVAATLAAWGAHLPAEEAAAEPFMIVT